jgi:hypothetical protein
MNSRRLIASTEAQDKASYRLKITLGMGRPMSALGQKQTCAVQLGMSALPPIADMCSALVHVRYVPKADIAAFECRTDSCVIYSEGRRRAGLPCPQCGQQYI